MLFNSYSYEILHKQFHWIYLQGDIKLLLVTVNNGLKFEIEIVHDLSCHPICCPFYTITISLFLTNKITDKWQNCVSGQRQLQSSAAVLPQTAVEYLLHGAVALRHIFELAGQALPLQFVRLQQNMHKVVHSHYTPITYKYLPDMTTDTSTYNYHRRSLTANHQPVYPHRERAFLNKQLLSISGLVVMLTFDLLIS